MSKPVKNALFILFVSLVCLLGSEVRACSTHLKREPIKFDRIEPEWVVQKHMLLYEDTVKELDANPVRLHERHWFFFGILTDHSYMDQIVKRWESHEPRFDSWHPYLWRMLDGYIHEPQTAAPPRSSAIPSDFPGLISEPTAPGINGRLGELGGGVPPLDRGEPGGDKNGGGPTPQAAVPEPSAFVLMLSGVILAGLGTTRRVLWDRALRAVVVLRR